MAINLGDKVRFLNENMEGIVTSIKGNNTIGVTIESDFEIPVLTSEVVKIKFNEQAGNKEEVAPAKSFKVQNTNPLGVFLAFERVGDTDLDVYLHNNFSEEVIVVYYHKDQGVFHLQKQYKLEREESLLIGRAKLNQFDQWPSYYFVILPLESVSVMPAKSIQMEYNFQAKTFHNYWKHCFFLNKQAYVFRLDESIEKLNLTALKARDFTEKVEANSVDLKAKPNSIIDLHYDALQRNGFGSANDITSFQMEVFTQTLESAYVHKMKEIVYIHGVGNSYLKNKIRTYLSKHPEIVAGFEDADILKFGSGATLVSIK